MTDAPKKPASLAMLYKAVPRLLLAASLALLCAIVLIAVLPQIVPGIFGTCFEGSCGYMAVFVFTPITMLVLTPIWWMLLPRAGSLTLLGLWFLLLLVIGFLILPKVVWAGGLLGMAWLMVQHWRQHVQQGLPVRDLFVRPKYQAL